MGVQARSVHKRIAVDKQGWAIIILECQRGHAVNKQGWALVLGKNLWTMHHEELLGRVLIATSRARLGQGCGLVSWWVWP
jgi:hypothetical protein